ncbi:MAG: GrpB family protein, partial [Chroococcidiopsis sp.]
TQIANLEALGYLYCGELGIPNRYYFRRGMPRTYQIHAVQIDSEFWRSHILFRNFLIAHPAAAKQYEDLKRKLAVEFRSDRDRYTNNKAPLIQQLLVQAQAWQKTL